MKHFFCFLLIVAALSCSKEKIEPCTIDPLEGNWQMVENGELTNNELELPDGFQFSIRNLDGENFEFQTESYLDTLQLQIDYVNAPNQYNFVGGCKNLLVVSYSIQDDIMDLYFMAKYQGGMGTSNYTMQNIDCPNMTYD